MYLYITLFVGGRQRIISDNYEAVVKYTLEKYRAIAHPLPKRTQPTRDPQQWLLLKSMADKELLVTSVTLLVILTGILVGLGTRYAE
jgi:hypothetical protein